MVTTKLEELIFNKQATSKILNCAWANFFTLNLKEKIAVIHQIDWFPFLNLDGLDTNQLIADVINKSSEYQLKIDSACGTNFMHFKGNIKINVIDGVALGNTTSDWSKLDVNAILQHGDMISRNCYLVVKEQIRFSVTRNLPISNFPQGVGTLLPTSKEPNFPNGIKNLNQLINFSYDNPPEGSSYYPAGASDASWLLPASNIKPSEYIQRPALIGTHATWETPSTNKTDTSYMYPLFAVHYVEITDKQFYNIFG